MDKKLECYFGVDPWSGAVRMMVPRLFAAEIYNDLSGSAQIRTIIDPDTVNEMSQGILQNNMAYREAVVSDDIHKHYVSSKIVRKVKRYLMAGEMEKARKKVWGYAWARLLDYIEQSDYILEDTDNLFLGRFEKKEMEQVLACCYKVDNRYVFNVPDNLFAVLNPDGLLKVNVQPEFIHGKAKQKFLELKDNPYVKKFTINRGSLDGLEKACFEGDIDLRDDLIKEMINWAIPLLKEDGD